MKIYFKTVAPYKILYHVFCQNYDDWCSSLLEAKKMVKSMREEGKESIRLYLESYDTASEYEQGNTSNEKCIYSVGPWPL